jgi:hypothetical protein
VAQGVNPDSSGTDLPGCGVKDAEQVPRVDGSAGPAGEDLTGLHPLAARVEPLADLGLPVGLEDADDCGGEAHSAS